MSERTEALARPLAASRLRPRIPDGTTAGRGVLRWLGLFALWSLPAVFSGSDAYLWLSGQGRQVSWSKLVGLHLPQWIPWALATPLIHRLACRFPYHRQRRLRFAAVHTLAAGSLSGVMLIYAAAVEAWLQSGWSGLSWGALRLWLGRLLPGRLGLYLLLYGAILGVAIAIESYRALRERELRASRLETLLAEARLEALRSQLQPHFLFNTLHSIATLVEDNPAAARTMIAQLGDLLRASLGQLAHQEVTLGEEFEMLDCYLDIEQTRFGDRLRIERQINADLLAAQVPYLVLQPLVENAIRHGIAVSSLAGRLAIGAAAAGERLLLTVSDDGPGCPQGGAVEEGIGLSNTRERLQQLYPGNYRVEAANLPRCGFQVVLDLPLRFAVGEVPEVATVSSALDRPSTGSSPRSGE